MVSDPRLYIGLMSGTSLDGADAVLLHIDAQGVPHVRGHCALPLPEPLRQTFLALNTSGGDELHLAALAANALAHVYAQAVFALLKATDCAASAITAIGAHGQTVRHRPQQFDGIGYTLQLNNPALLAELTGVDVVADFRSRDLAAGGQGAPLVPAFHAHAFGRPNATVAVLNIGGISNLSVLRPGAAPLGWDCGPGNALLDSWCQTHTGAPYDQGGLWAASGQVQGDLLDVLMSDSYLQLPPPKSTGRDRYNLPWLAEQLALAPRTYASADVQATLTAWTAQICAQDVQRHAPDASELLVCGGGAFNTHLMQHLRQHVPALHVCNTEQRGIPALQVEAAAFAWLAHQNLMRQPGSLASVTGAGGNRVLGALYPA